MLERLAPYIIPIAYLLLILWLQPGDRLGGALGVPARMRLLWDDFDWTAVALRALNAESGRVPGVMVDPCTKPGTHSLRPDQANNGTLSHEFFLEYPDTALWLFRLLYRLDHHIRGRYYGPEFLDICHYFLVFHVPSNNDELALWRYLRRAGQSYAIAAILCMLGLIAIVRSGYESSKGAALSVFLLMCPATLYFTANRFDILPALMTALSVWCLGRDRIAASAAFLATGAMIKVFPVLLAPFFLRYLLRNRRKVVLWSIVFGATLVVLFLPTVLRLGLTAATAPYRYQLSREFEFYSIYGWILPRALGTHAWSWLRSGIVILAVACLIIRPIGSIPSLLRRCAVVLALFVILQVFFSPQWILWLAPFLVPLAGLNWRLAVLYVALDLVMYVNFPILYISPDLLHLGWLLSPAVIYLRFAITIIIIWTLLRWEYHPRTTTASQTIVAVQG